MKSFSAISWLLWPFAMRHRISRSRRVSGSTSPRSSWASGVVCLAAAGRGRALWPRRVGCGPVCSQALDELRGRRRADHGRGLPDGADRVDEFLRVGVFEQETAGPGGDGAEDVVIAIEGGENDHPGGIPRGARGGKFVEDAAGRSDAV